MLQTYIPYTPKDSIRINDKMAIDVREDDVVFYTATGPIYSYRPDDKFGKRLAQGIMVDMKLATPSELARVLGVNQTTVSRNATIYKKKGPSGFFDIRTNRGAYRFTKEKQKIVKGLLEKETTIVAAAAEVGISEGSIRRALKNGTIKLKKSGTKQAPTPEKIKGPAERSQEDVACNGGVATKRETERVLASQGELEEAAPEFTANEGVNYAGVLLALPFLAGLDYLKTGTKVYGALKKGYYGLQSVLLTLAFMALLRFKTPEQIKKSNPGDFGIILGLDRCPEVKTLRRKLKEFGVMEKSGELMDRLTRSWVKQDEDIIGFSYIDGHVRPYHGRKHILPKTHVARRRLCMPATTDFWVNGSDCEPLFFVTTEANDSLLKTVENDIIPTLKKLSKGERVTLVFDREGWSPDRFLKWADEEIDVLTYRKGSYKPWPSECFVEVSSQVRGKPVTYKLGERSIKIKKKGWLREVRRLCNDGHQTSIISTRQDLTMEEVARKMFQRWNQENYFKYMREEYGLDHLVSRDVEQADIERMVPNPEKKELKKGMNKKRNQLKKKKEEYGSKASENDEKQCRTMRGFNISNPGLKSEIKQLEKEVATLESEIKSLPEKVKIKQILSEDKIVKLETEKKRLTDTIKMTCYRAETEMVNILAQTQCFARTMDEGRTFIKSVFQHTADILPNYEDGKMEIRFHTMPTNRENQALKKLCEVVNKEKFSYPKTNLQMVFKAA